MNTPEKCPKCGDPLKDGWDNVYQCGSAFYTEGPLARRIREHYECIRLQRNQLSERVKRLEEIGDKMAAHIDGEARLWGLESSEFGDEWRTSKSHP